MQTDLFRTGECLHDKHFSALVADLERKHWLPGMFVASWLVECSIRGELRGERTFVHVRERPTWPEEGVEFQARFSPASSARLTQIEAQTGDTKEEAAARLIALAERP